MCDWVLHIAGEDEVGLIHLLLGAQPVQFAHLWQQPVFGTEHRLAHLLLKHGRLLQVVSKHL